MILLIIIGYLIQMLICSVINMIIGARIPRSGVDLLKLTFLPWLLFNLKEVQQ